MEILIPGEARARNTDPLTSHDAAATVRNITETHNAILTFIRIDGPMTDFELLARWRKYCDRGWLEPISESGLRTRRSELVAAGYLEDSGRRGKTPSGRSCIIWQVAP